MDQVNCPSDASSSLPPLRIASGCLSPVWNMGFRPCGRCEQCQRQDGWRWAQRALVEMKLRPTVFATWTFRPRGKHWVPTRDNTWPDVQKCLKRMRNDGLDFRYLCAPEFGDLRGRHHFHLLLHGEVNTKQARRYWRQGITHARRAIPSDAQYVADYASKQSGRKCASLRYGLPDKGDLTHGIVAEIFKHFPKARIEGVSDIVLPYQQQKKITSDVRADVPLLPKAALARIEKGWNADP